LLTEDKVPIDQQYENAIRNANDAARLNSAAQQKHDKQMEIKDAQIQADNAKVRSCSPTILL
jgi:hypothetical protein